MLRNEHAQMIYSLLTARQYLKNKHRKELTAEQIAAFTQDLDFLEQVLEFSATWNGVQTTHFFPELSNIKNFLEKNDMLRLGRFFSQPFFQVSKDLHRIGGEYPLVLKKLYEAYYVRTLHKKANPSF